MARIFYFERVMYQHKCKPWTLANIGHCAPRRLNFATLSNLRKIYCRPPTKSWILYCVHYTFEMHLRINGSSS